jgi:hypothetical protein
MKNEFEQTFTKDGSPTLRIKDSRETMHHSAGAAAETLYIYKSVLDVAYSLPLELKTCVLGLGLGYIEIAWAMVLLQSKRRLSLNLNLTSFEIEQRLRDNFSEWVCSDKKSIYDQVLESLSSGGLLNDIKQILKSNFLQNPIEGDLLTYQDLSSKWNIICYDAFGSEYNRHLWSEDFLKLFVQRYCAEDCVFTTYAHTGALKKVLQQSGFVFLDRPGFQGKRSSTLALRGVFKTEYLPHFYRTF